MSNVSTDNQEYLKQLEDNLTKNSFNSDNIFSLSHLKRNLKQSGFKRVSFINPGPSLDEERIKESLLKDFEDPETYLVCSDVTLPGLIEGFEVIPHCVINVDPNPKVLTFFKALDPSINIDVIMPTGGVLHGLTDLQAYFYLFNSVEENEYYRINRDLLNTVEGDYLETIKMMINKSEYVSNLLKEFGVFRKYPNLLARGTVTTTMVQVAQLLPTFEINFYGSDFSVKKDKPYAEFVSEANAELVREQLDLDMSVDRYKEIILAGYGLKKDDESIKDIEEDKYFNLPLLTYYYKQLQDYINITGFSSLANIKFN